MTDITHLQTAETQAFEKVSSDMKRCFETWEAAGINPSLAMWAMVVLVTETLRSALGDHDMVASFMLSAMNSSLKDDESKVN